MIQTCSFKLPTLLVARSVASCFDCFPQRSPCCILILFERTNVITLSGDPHQLVSFVAKTTKLFYVLDFIHNHCNISVVNCLSLVKRAPCFFKYYDFKPLSTLRGWLWASKINITMLHFVLFHNIACYNESLIARIHVNTEELRNITCTCYHTCDYKA